MTTSELDIQSLTLEMIESAYAGKAHSCCCGCSGTHYQDDPKAMTKILRTVQANEESAEVTSEYVAATVGKRVFIVHLKREVA